MTTLARATAAPITIVIDKKTYRFSPFQHMDYGEFENWAQDRYMALASRSVKKFPEELRPQYMQDATEYASHLTITHKDMPRLMSSLDGAVFLVWLSLRHNHPDIGLPEVGELMTDDVKSDKFMTVLERLTSEIKTRKKKTVRKRPTKPKPRKKPAKQRRPTKKRR